MNNKMKNRVVTTAISIFFLIMEILCTISYFHPIAHSESERRDLAQFPTNITAERIFDKTAILEFEDYTVDQFPFREVFRSLKAHFQLNVLHLTENNGMVMKDGYIAKITPEFNEDLVTYSAERLEYVYDKYLKTNGGDKYLSIIPDKNYYLGRDYGYPSPNYDFLTETVRNTLPEVSYIDIFDCLELEDFYRTDTHWSQNKILKAAKKLATDMNKADRFSETYTEHELDGFEGVYCKQSALHPEPDTLIYLTNDIIDDCLVYDYETEKYSEIYDLEQFESKDGYNIFLSGAKALLRIDNPNAETTEELIIFRDSFGSSLAPLLTGNYKSIYLVDIRYIEPDYLDEFIDFNNKDVLFLYSTLILNQMALK